MEDTVRVGDTIYNRKALEIGLSRYEDFRESDKFVEEEE
jgi:hypothetical protein